MSITKPARAYEILLLDLPSEDLISLPSLALEISDLSSSSVPLFNFAFAGADSSPPSLGEDLSKAGRVCVDHVIVADDARHVIEFVDRNGRSIETQK